MDDSRVNRLFSQEAGKGYTKRVRHTAMQAFPFWIASIITGIVAVLYTKMFDWCSEQSMLLFHQRKELLFIITPVCFVLGWWIVKKFDKNAAGSGIPQVVAALELSNPRYNYLIDKLLSIRCAVVKILSSLLMVFGGAAIGREGPTVQIAGSIFRKVNLLMPKTWMRVSRKNMIMTGAAAGLAAAFNTPLGGIVFAIEELSKTHFNHFKTAIFTAVIIAGLTAQGLLGNYLYLGFPILKNLSGYIFIYVAAVAMVCGLMGIIMSSVILKFMKFRRTLVGKKTEIMYVIGASLIVALIAYFGNYDVLGSGKHQMTEILFSQEKHVSWMLPIYRIIGPIASFTTGAAGGVFAPSLAAGATSAAVMAEWFNLSASDANLLILAGMVAFLTGITHSPFTSAILVLEMTDEHNVIFHLMMAGIIASLVALFIDRRSLYDHIKEYYLKDGLQEQNDADVNNTNQKQEPKTQ